MVRAGESKPLTPEQILALGVLLGDPAVSADILLDYLEDGGRVLRSADEVRKEERLDLLLKMHDRGDIFAETALKYGIDVRAWGNGADVQDVISDYT